MQHYPNDDPYEREPLDSSSYTRPSASRRRPLPPNNGYSQPESPYHDNSPRQYRAPAPQDRYREPERAQEPASGRLRGGQDPYGRDPYGRDQYGRDPYAQDSYAREPLAQESYARSSPSPQPFVDDRTPDVAPAPPRHGDNSYYAPSGGAESSGMAQARHNPSSTITPGADNFGEAAAGGMAGIAYTVAERNARESGVEAARAVGNGQLPPPPSRTQYPNAPPQAYPAHGGAYDGAGYGHNMRRPDPRGYGGGVVDRDSYSTLAVPSVGASGSRSPSRVRDGLGRGDYYPEDPFRSDPALDMLDPNDIEDDGDDGLHYPRQSQRNSILSSTHSDRGTRVGAGAAAAVGGAAAAGGALGGAMSYYGPGGPGRDAHDLGGRKAERSSGLPGQKKGHSKRWRWVIIGVVCLVICGGIAGGIAGGLIAGNKSGGGHGKSAADDEKDNGDLNIHSAEIQKLLKNPDLHRVFPGMDYTPINTQYPDCLTSPPSQNNVTRDVAVLSQLTNKIRLYGTDCNQTQMLIHAISQLEMQDDVKIWLGVWQDNNDTTNARQLQEMWNILDDYGDKPFEGIIVANEILFRKQMTESQLGTLLGDVRTKLKSKGLDLPVATSDLGDDWTSALAEDSDVLMANIHPFFSGVTASEAAAWAYNFWQTNDAPFFKSNKSDNIISETGWPSAGGTDCGGASSCTDGAVAGIDEMNTYMADWVCQALENGTNYFWFEAFDEPWKIQFDTKGAAWEDKWGLMDVNRNLKDGVKIPDCGGKTVG